LVVWFRTQEGEGNRQQQAYLSDPRLRRPTKGGRRGRPAKTWPGGGCSPCRRRLERKRPKREWSGEREAAEEKKAECARRKGWIWSAKGSLVVTLSLGTTSGPGIDFLWKRISQDVTAFVLSVVCDVSVDSEASVVTLSILRICRHSLQRCS
jgi:hypothetical protein